MDLSREGNNDRSIVREEATIDKKKKKNSRWTFLRRSIVKDKKKEKRNQQEFERTNFLSFSENELVDLSKEGCVLVPLLLFNGSEFMDETSYFSGSFPAANERVTQPTVGASS